MSVTMPCEPLDCVPVASSWPQSPEPSSALSGTRTTGTPPLEYWTSTVPPLPTAYWVHVRMLWRECKDRMKVSAWLGGWEAGSGRAHSVVADTLLGKDVFAETLMLAGYIERKAVRARESRFGDRMRMS